MRTSGIFWRIYRAYAIVILFSLSTALLLLRPVLYSFLSEAESARILYAVQAGQHQLEASLLLQDMSGRDTWTENPSLVEKEIQRLALELNLHVALFSSNNSLLTQSRELPNQFLGFATPLVAKVAETKTVQKNFEHSAFFSEKYYLAAAPLASPPNASNLGNEYILLLGIDQGLVSSATNRLWYRTLIAFGIALLVGGIVAFVQGQSFSRPLEVMQRYAERFGQGDFKRKVPSPPNVELSVLANSLNTMAGQLDSRISEITQQRNEQQAILESMREGVIALDLNERILSLNHRAEQFLGVNALEVRGTLLQEYLRHVDLQRFVATTLRGNYTLDEDLPTQLRFGKDRLFEARSAPLRDANDNDIGVIIILNDVTRLNQLENIRRDFVANVSHELRTPITSILGFTETLLDGALEEPEQARRFLEIIERQSNRLTQVIDDLLNLSRLEKKDDLKRESVQLSLLLQEGAEVIFSEASKNGTQLIVETEQDGKVMLNQTLMIQALSNLVGNAVRYTGGNGKRVWIKGTLKDGKVIITVKDEGPGIAKEHLPRLFERFYRVDKARSRDLGGTGLGLSIVQHVAQVHQGEVRVESSIEKGSEFIIELPVS